jgi:sugar phosphate permease
MKNRLNVIAWFSVTYFFYYLARYNYPVALPFIKEELALSATQIGWIATALTVGYAFGQLINGVLVDRKGPRMMMTIGGVGSMMANVMMGGSYIYTLFVLAWLVNGYFQAMGYPASLRLIANWFQPGERGRAVGASEFAQSLAAILILPLAGFLASQFSWRLVFLVPGIMMGLVILWFDLVAKDYPPSPNGKMTMRELLEIPLSVGDPRHKPLLQDMLQRYRLVFADPRLLCANLSYGFSQFVRYAMITWIPAYLFESTGMGIFSAALAGTSFQIGGAFGSVLVGWLADLPVLQRKQWLIIATGMIGSSIAAVAVGVLPAGAGTIVALALCGVGIEALEVAYFLLPVTFLGEDMTATGVGCMNATGKAVASLQGVTLGAIIDTFGYGSAFGTAGAFGLLAAVLVLPVGVKKWAKISL